MDNVKCIGMDVLKEAISVADLPLIMSMRIGPTVGRFRTSVRNSAMKRAADF